MTNKYKNKKILVDGHLFDSHKEANHYSTLKLLAKSGAISDLELQPRFELIPKFKRGKKTIRKCEYIADFRYIDNEGRTIIEDVKSEFTRKNPVYKLKIKLLFWQYPDVIFYEV